MMGEDTPGTFTPRTERRGFIMDQIEALQHMLALGSDLVDAVVACISGHRMTPDMAALCITTYWRRYAAIAQYQEARGAAITIQAIARSKLTREQYGEYLMSAPRMQSPSGDDRTEEDLIAFHAIQQLQAVWRGHLARAFVDKLKYKSKTKLQRTFSWSNKSKRTKPSFQNRSAKDILAAAGVDGGEKPKPVRRSMSFDRFSRTFSKPKLDDSGKAPPTPSFSKQLLFILLHRGPNGLGLELDATNTVVNMVPGGAAEVQGYFREGDTIASVDGIPLRGRLLQDVMDRSKSSYSFDVWRISRIDPDPVTPKANTPVRRAFSFDRKRR